MALFKLMASIGLDDSSFQAGLKRAESALSKLGSQLVASFSVGAVAAFTQQLVNAAEAVADLSEQLGITTDEAQALQRAAARSGIEVNQYASALIKLKQARNEALSGNQAKTSQFRTLGLDPSQGEFELLRGIGKAQSPEEISAAFDLIGTKAGKALSSLKEIRGLGELELISESNVKALSSAKDDLGEIYTTIKAIAANTLGDRLRELTLGSVFALRAAFGFFDSRDRPRPRNLPEPEEPTGESEYTRAVQSIELTRVTRQPAAARREAMRLMAQSFSSLPSDELSRIGGGFGSNSGLGSIEREMLRFTKAMAEDLNSIRATADAAANGKAPE